MSEEAKAILKKTFWIVLGIIGIALACLLILPLFFKNKETSLAPVQEIAEKVKLEVDKIDIDTQIEIAKSRGKEESFIKELKSLKLEIDRKERLERLAKLLD